MWALTFLKGFCCMGLGLYRVEGVYKVCPNFPKSHEKPRKKHPRF